MKKIAGIFTPNTGVWSSYSNDVHTVMIGDCICEWIGTPKTLEDDTEEQVIAEIYASDATPTEKLKGVYLAIVYHKESKQLRIFQDRSTSPLALYYTSYNGIFYYSTNLKTLLRDSKIPRALDPEAVQNYLINGYIWGNTTLVENVKKLAPFEWITVSENGVECHKATYPFTDLSESEGVEQWRSVLDRAIVESVDGESRLCTALSSGYDSNYILHVLHRDTDKPIDCFSVGGKFGKNELPQVMENAKEYERVTLHTALTDRDTLSTLPDLVWRLEGAVYEVGTFLQYELNRALANANVHKIVCGECADQVMQEWYFTENRLFELPENTYFEFDTYPFVYAHSVILKKNGILGNSFNIESMYPFLDTDFVNVAQALGKINMKDKRYHVRVCRDVLSDTILGNISKIGGATEVHSLFDTNEDAERLLQTVRNSKLFQTYGATCAYGGYARSALEKEANAWKNKVRNGIFSILHLNTKEREQSRYFLKEMALREALCYLSVILFEKLFLSGEYDEFFDDAGISVKLSEFGY